MKKVFKKWWFWLVMILIFAIVFFVPMHNCINCYVFPDEDGVVRPNGRCCVSLIDIIK